MRFRVGPYVYRVRVTEDPITDEATGEVLLGKAVMKHRELLIAAAVRPPHRMEVLLHELKHAWLFHFPRPSSEEEECQFFAAITTQAMQDLREQGGAEVLERLRPDAAGWLDDDAPEPIDLVPVPVAVTEPAEADACGGDTRQAPSTYVYAYESKARAHGGRVHCCTCGLVVNAAAVVSAPARWNVRAQGTTVDRMLFCPHCEHLQVWTEGADIYGRPNGGLVADPVIRRGRDVEKFLREHPEATGIIVG